MTIAWSWPETRPLPRMVQVPRTGMPSLVGDELELRRRDPLRGQVGGGDQGGVEVGRGQLDLVQPVLALYRPHVLHPGAVVGAGERVEDDLGRGCLEPPPRALVEPQPVVAVDEPVVGPAGDLARAAERHADRGVVARDVERALDLEDGRRVARLTGERGAVRPVGVRGKGREPVEDRDRGPGGRRRRGRRAGRPVTGLRRGGGRRAGASRSRPASDGSGPRATGWHAATITAATTNRATDRGAGDSGTRSAHRSSPGAGRRRPATRQPTRAAGVASGCRRPSAAISARRPTPSLARMCSTCALAVRVARPSRAATSPFVRPSATSVATSHSRPVSGLHGASSSGEPGRPRRDRAASCSGHAAELVGQRLDLGAEPRAASGRRFARWYARARSRRAHAPSQARPRPVQPLGRRGRAAAAPRPVEPACEREEAAGVVDGRAACPGSSGARARPRPRRGRRSRRGRIGRGEVRPACRSRRTGTGRPRRAPRATRGGRPRPSGSRPSACRHAAGRPRRGPTAPVTGAAARPSARPATRASSSDTAARSSSPRPSATNPSTWSAVIRVVIPPRPSCLACSATASASSQRPVAHRTWARCAAR